VTGLLGERTDVLRGAGEVLGGVAARQCEAAIVDNRELNVVALETEDDRSYAVKVAGPAALLVTKAHKLGGRQSEPSRLMDKDAHDTYRLVRATETQEIVDGYDILLRDGRSAAVARAGLAYLRRLFGDSSSTGAIMAGRVEEGIGNPSEVSASVVALVNDVLDAVDEP
jgi:hypothetical protein